MTDAAPPETMAAAAAELRVAVRDFLEVSGLLPAVRLLVKCLARIL